MLSELETGASHAVDFPENRSAPIFIEVTRVRGQIKILAQALKYTLHILDGGSWGAQ